jgi:hypothetical protein
VSLRHVVTIFYSVYMIACLYVVGLVGNTYVSSFHELSLLARLGRTLEFVYVMLSLPSLGLTMGVG